MRRPSSCRRAIRACSSPRRCEPAGAAEAPGREPPGLARAGKVGDEPLLFASRMREGLLAASVTIGLQAMAEVMAAEVTELAGPKTRRDSVARRLPRP